MENIKVVSEDTTTNKAAPKEKDFQPQSQEFNAVSYTHLTLPTNREV